MAERQTGNQVGKKAESQKEIYYTDGHTQIQRSKHEDRKTIKQKDRKTERQKDRKTERQKDRWFSL